MGLPLKSWVGWSLEFFPFSELRPRVARTKTYGFVNAYLYLSSREISLDVRNRKLGQKVPEFELSTYEPSTGKFGNFCLADQILRKRWTIVFFYPADFTFV